MSPKVSVIIPVYNVETYLPRCLESLIVQTLEDIEIICVDDESTDGSLALLRSYAAREPRMKVLTQKNKRQGGARNTGLDIARGEYVLYIDSDDWIDPDYCEVLYRAAVRHDADVAVGAIRKDRVSPPLSKWVIRFDEERVVEDLAEKFAVCQCPPDFHPVNKMLRREALLRAGFRFREYAQYEDVEYVMQILGELGRLVTVAGPTYHYVVHEGSTVKGHQTVEKQLNKYHAHKAFVAYADKKGLQLKPKHRNLTKRFWTLGGITVLKLKDQDGRLVWRLFDFLPIWVQKG